MVRSGWLNLNRNSLAYFGINGYSWSNTTNIHSPTWADAYDLNFYTTEVLPTFANARRLGFPVRCLVILCCNFVRSGDIALGLSALWGFGSNGYNWPSTSSIYLSSFSASSYWFEFTSSMPHPSLGPYSRRLGFPVRCLV